MNNNIKDWRDSTLPDDEIEMLESIENGEWKSIGNIDERRNNLREFFSDNGKSTNLININLVQEDFDIIIKIFRANRCFIK